MSAIKSGMVFLLLTVYAITTPLYAESESEFEESTSIGLIISSLPEAKFTVSQNFTFPFLPGEHFLVSGNNIQFNVQAELTPISMGLLGEAVLTPVAFFEFIAGGMIGTGWNIKLFGSDIYGIGINKPTEDGNSAKIDGSPWGGVFGKANIGGAVQFDMAAVIPGDWHHIVFRSYHEINYMGYSGAKKGDAWVFEDDYRENQNGFNYYGNYLIGYQMPIFLDTVALLAEMYQYLYHTPGGDAWGDSLGRWEFSAILNFAVTRRFNIALITQFHTMRNYTEDHDYYRFRLLDKENSRYFEFYRVVAIMGFRLRSSGDNP